MATQKGRNWSSGDIVTAANLSSIERGVSALAEEYTPTTWANGNTVTAAGLNNIEQGIVNGGSSDFSTAQMMIINNTEYFVTFPSPQCLEENALGSGSPAMIYLYADRIEPATTKTIKAPLYKGGLYLISTNATSVSGNATLMNDDVLVTGDCTITISDSSGGGAS